MLFDLDANGDLVGMNEPDSEEPPPRLFVARGRTAVRAWFAGVVTPPQRAACESAIARLPPWDGQPSKRALYEPINRALGAEAAIGWVTVGPAFRFGEPIESPADVDARVIEKASAHLLEPHFPYTRSHLDLRSPVVGAVVEGRVVAACYSARKRPSAAEAGVDTIGPYRGRGLAPAAVAGWARAAAQVGLEPLYSTAWDNAASLAVARKLRLVAYADTYAVR